MQWIYFHFARPETWKAKAAITGSWILNWMNCIATKIIFGLYSHCNWLRTIHLRCGHISDISAKFDMDSKSTVSCQQYCDVQSNTHTELTFKPRIFLLTIVVNLSEKNLCGENFSVSHETPNHTVSYFPIVMTQWLLLQNFTEQW